MSRMRKAALVAAAVAVLAGAAGALAIATGGGDDDSTQKPITGNALKRAEAAALEHTGEGRVTETEVDDEESYYEVEVTRADGSQTDVQLDRDFDVVGSEGDDDREED